MFMLREYRGDRVAEPGILQPVSAQESLIIEDENTGGFTDGSTVYPDRASLLQALTRHSVQSFITVRERSGKTRPDASEKMMAPNVTGVSPRNVNAGSGDIVTITGTNFGTTPRRRLFRQPGRRPRRPLHLRAGRRYHFLDEHPDPCQRHLRSR